MSYIKVKNSLVLLNCRYNNLLVKLISAELQKIVHLLFIAGEDYDLSEREKVMLESKAELPHIWPVATRFFNVRLLHEFAFLK